MPTKQLGKKAWLTMQPALPAQQEEQSLASLARLKAARPTKQPGKKSLAYLASPKGYHAASLASLARRAEPG